MILENCVPESTITFSKLNSSTTDYVSY